MILETNKKLFIYKNKLDLIKDVKVSNETIALHCEKDNDVVKTIKNTTRNINLLKNKFPHHFA